MPSGPNYDIFVNLKGSDTVTKQFKEIDKAAGTVTTTVKKFDANGKQLTETVRTLNKGTGETEVVMKRLSGTTLSASAAAIRFHTGFMAAAAGATVLVGALRGAWREFVTLAKEGAEAEASVEAMRAALRSHGHEVDNNTRAIEEFGKQMQDRVATDGDKFIAMLARMEAATGANVPVIKQMGLAAVGLAQIMKQDLDTAGTTVIRTMNGSNRAFKALGIEVQKNWTPQERLAALLHATSAGLEQATEKAKGTEGQIAKLELKWGDLREKVGQVITQNPELLDSLNKLVDGPLPKLVDAVAKLVGWFTSWPTGLQATALGLMAVVPAINAVNVALGTGGLLGTLKGIAGLVAKFPILATLLKGGAFTVVNQGVVNNMESARRTEAAQRSFYKKGNIGPVPTVKVKGKEQWGFSQGAIGSGAGIMDVAAGAVVNSPAPAWRSNLNKAFDAEGLMSIAGSDNYLQSAFQLAGGAIGGPIGGFLGGGIARTLKGLFGGGGKEDRGLEPSKPIYTSDVQLTERITQFLNVALPLLAKGGGLAIDRATGQLPTFGATAGGVR